MIRKVEIEDTLHHRAELALVEAKKLIANYVKKNHSKNLPRWRGELNEEGEIHSLVESYVPTSSKELKDTAYLYEKELEECYESLWSGEDPLDSYVESAIYLFIWSHIYDWYDKEGEAYFYQLTKERVKK